MHGPSPLSPFKAWALTTWSSLIWPSPLVFSEAWTLQSLGPHLRVPPTISLCSHHLAHPELGSSYARALPLLGPSIGPLLILGHHNRVILSLSLHYLASPKSGALNIGLLSLGLHQWAPQKSRALHMGPLQSLGPFTLGPSKFWGPLHWVLIGLFACLTCSPGAQGPASR